jgi:hypothetical protein
VSCPILRTDEENVTLVEFHLRIGYLNGGNAFEVIVHCNSKDLLRRVLTDHILIEKLLDFVRLGSFLRLRKRQVLRRCFFFLENEVAKIHAFVTNVNARTRDDLQHLFLPLAAERAADASSLSVLAVSSIESKHVPLCGGDVLHQNSYGNRSLMLPQFTSKNKQGSNRSLVAGISPSARRCPPGRSSSVSVSR